MSTASTADKAQFPQIVFWDENAPLLSMINPGDFSGLEILQKLGVSNLSLSSSFGTKDREEILRRQRVVGFLMNNPDVRAALASSGISRRFPSTAQGFLDELWTNPRLGHNAFFYGVHQLIQVLESSGQMPQELAVLHCFLTDTVPGAEELENQLAAEMGKDLQKAVALQGVVEVVRRAKRGRGEDWSIVNSEVYGYQRYSFHLSGLCRERKRPRWMEGRIAQRLGLSRAVEAILSTLDRGRVRRRYADLLLREMPKDFEKAILAFASSVFGTAEQFLNEYDEAHFKLHFSFENESLMVRLISVSSCFGSELVGYYEEEVEKRQRDLGCFAPTVSGNFPGYSKKDLARIASQNESMRVAEIRLARQTSFSLNVLESLKKEKPSLLSTGMEAPSSHLVREFRDQTIIGLRQDAKYAQRYGRAEEYRLFVTEKVAELRAIAQIVDRLEAKAKEWDLPLNMPEIRPAAEHVVSFDRLVPIHLIGRQVGEKILRPRDLVPVTMPHPLNGRMIGLTGQNAGGKTVIEETIITNIFLAQSGLPVFGERLLLNPKNALGLVFLERGEGSTLELMLKKTRSVLEAVQASTENGIVVFLDEVGTGTQEEGGLAIGERILRKLSQHGCSVMFSTQITALAEKAKRDMNALCCQVDLGHSIQPGIGTGGAEILARKLGIDQLLQ